MTFRSILLAGIAALAPGTLAATAAADGAAVQDSTRAFRPDRASYILTRTQWRSLADGGQIVVSRDYAIEIRPCEGGYKVDGKLVATSVDAPARLEPLARLERLRGEDGLFPLHLDQSGLIVPGPGTADEEGHRQAAQQSRGLVTGAALPAPVRDDALAMVDRIVASASTATAWPADLFNPARRQSTERRTLPLPGGEQGEVSVSIRVEGLQPGTVPAAVERTVVTRIAGSERSTRERWTLGPS